MLPARHATQLSAALHTTPLVALLAVPPRLPTRPQWVSRPRQVRYASASSERWKTRQVNDRFDRSAKVKDLMSRAAFKLIELNDKYKLFKEGQVVIDVGYAPGSWSQVAREYTKPTGLVLGIDLIPAQPPMGVHAIQGNFLAPGVQTMVKEFLEKNVPLPRSSPTDPKAAGGDGSVVEDRPSYIDQERASTQESAKGPAGQAEVEKAAWWPMVDIILSDMSDPWPQTTGFGSKTMSLPYRMLMIRDLRLMNVSGNPFRDHARSMDLCTGALPFVSEALKPGGHFVCKFYQGKEDKVLENRLKKLFTKVHREKPEASRDESKELYFVALKRKGNVKLDERGDVVL